jgi:hypothetical protein
LGGGEATHITCYNCGKLGHVQAACTEEPFCIKCNKVGHLSAMCAFYNRAAEPFWAGYGSNGVGFVCCEVSEEEMLPPAPNAARISLEIGSLSAEQLEDELKDLVDEGWNWNVQQLSESDFAAFFPSKESLRMAIRGGGLNLPMSKLHVNVEASVGDPAAADHLEEVWVKLFDVPAPYKQPSRILLATRELGRPVGVDEASLDAPDSPVRLLVGCKRPVALPSFIMMYVNSQGFKVRVQLDSEKMAVSSAPPPPPKPLGDDKDEDLEESEGDGWDGRRGKHIRKGTEPANPRPESRGFSGAPKHKSVAMDIGTASRDPSEVVIPSSALSQYGSNLLGKGDIFPILKNLLTSDQAPTQLEEPEDSDEDQPPLSPSLVTDSTTPEGLSTPRRDPRSQGKAMHLSDQDRVEAGISPSWESDPDAMRARERRSKSNLDRPSLVRNLDGKDIAIQLVFEGDNQGAKEGLGSKPMDGEVIGELAASVVRAPRTKSSAGGPSRFSRRGATASAEPILQRAMARAEQKATGIYSKSLHDFAALPNSSDEHLLAVAKDSCIVFPSAAGNPAPLLSIIRAKELAQAELALARDKLAAEKAKTEALKQPDTVEATGVASQSPSLSLEGSGGQKKRAALAVKRKAHKKPAAVRTRILTRQARGRKAGPQ